MIRPLLKTVLLAVLLLIAVPASAQAPTLLELGQRVTGSAAAQGGDFHAFAAVAGTRLSVSLSLPGLGAVAIYDDQGEELAYAEGHDRVLLAHTLDEDGVYLLGVTRAAKGADYALALDGQVPRIAYVYDDEDSTAAKADGAPVATTPAAPPRFVADAAVWGVYAQLAGRRTVLKDAYRVAWVWQQQGQVLLELWLDKNEAVLYTSTITPTGVPGELQLHSDTMAGNIFDGRLDGAGNVTFSGRGLVKTPYQVSLLAGGVMEMRRVKVKDGVSKPMAMGGVRTLPLEPITP